MPIATTPEDARLLFERWREDSARIRIQLRSHTLFFHGTGVVTASSADAIELGGDSWAFTIPLEDVVYSYSDPREIPVASIREVESAKYEHGLSLRLPNGDELILLEWKPSAEPRDEDE